MILLISLLGCENGLTLPPADDAPVQDGPLRPNAKMEVRERRHILPGFDSSPPPPEPVVTSSQCDDMEDGGLINGPDCLTGTISCGQTIVGHTKGGVNLYNTKFYERNFCTPALTDHSGGDERVYKLVMPPGENKAFVYLDTPCADLDIAAINATGDTCPTDSTLVPRCEMFPKRSTNREKLEIVSQGPSTWWIVVEGVDDEEGPFAIHVQCREGLI